MKSALIPSLQVDLDLRRAIEAVLREEESLSTFMEKPLRDQITRCQLQREFVVHGLASRDEARRADEYFPAESVHAELHALLTKASADNTER